MTLSDKDLRRFGKRKNHDITGMFLGALGFLGLMALIYSLPAQYDEPVEVLPSHTVSVTVREYPPIKDEKNYRRFHHTPTVEDAKLARELSDEEFIIEIMNGKKP